jgi:hypothetical protein
MSSTQYEDVSWSVKNRSIFHYYLDDMLAEIFFSDHHLLNVVDRHIFEIISGYDVSMLIEGTKIV